MNFDHIDTFPKLQCSLFGQYKKHKREGLVWLLCFLYSLPTMQYSGECTPSTPVLCRLGNKERSESTVKRYLAILIKLQLIKRTFPTGRTHKIEATEFGQKLFNRSAQNQKHLSQKSQIDRLNKTLILNIKKTTNNLEDIDAETYHKPVIKKMDYLILRNLLKKCTESKLQQDELANQIAWSINFGTLMCKKGERKGTLKYHKIQDAIKIGVFLVKSGRWKIPMGYENNSRGLNMIRTTEQKVYKSCCECKTIDWDVKQILTESSGLMQICTECYVKNLKKECAKIRKMLIREICKEYQDISGKNLTLSRFFLFVYGLYYTKAESFKPNFKLIQMLNVKKCPLLYVKFPVITAEEMKAMLKCVSVVEQFFKFHRKED